MRIVALAAAALLLASAGTVSAAPLNPVKTAPIASDSSGVINVHRRGYRHCHWRNGKKRCHGPYRTWRQPGFSLYLNFDNDRRRHHRNRNWR